VWFRRDLRINDHAALHAACATGLDVTALYIHAPSEDGEWRRGGASKAWLHKSLAALALSLQRLGIPLLIRRGPSAAALHALCTELDVAQVFWHRLYEPTSVARDTQIKAELTAQRIGAHSFAGHVLNEPWAFKTGAGDVYRVFTPYWRNGAQRVQPAEPLPAPERITPARNASGELPQGLALSALALAAPAKLARWRRWRFFTTAR
jgi:deoxyribodipyrimidine photo-lyase